MSKIILTSTLLFSSVIAFAGSVPSTPIDGGLSLLLVAAGAFGVKKIYDNKKEQ